MNNKRCVLSALGAILLLFAFHATNARAQQPSACITCHEFLGSPLAEPVEKWRGSVHEQNGIACDDCHQGNSRVDLGDIRQLSSDQFTSKQAAAMSKAQGFVGMPSGQALFDMCDPCHSSSVDRYARSIMGKAYLENKGGPSCVLCHNAHRNAMPQVPKTCQRCHKDVAGFDRIDPMNVTQSTISELSGIRIKLAQEKTAGSSPPLFPEFPEDLESFQIGFAAFGAIIVLLVIGYIVHIVLERGR